MRVKKGVVELGPILERVAFLYVVDLLRKNI